MITMDAVMDISREALFLIIKVSLPVLLVSLCVGLVVSIFQTVTSIQEQTLTFVPKIVCVFLALVLFGNWMMTAMVEFMTSLWSNFGLYANR
ncbi:flagellar biosynthetic protein FliQ [bacterium D16-50]|jgi:flagellar biosynthetic protein FliQ|nr:flagellar biosynthesis protein FliQ [Lachnospiraceae bacterium]RKJ18613.1 flagellar biosynthetic protein FliQ [bacterium D16-50]